MRRAPSSKPRQTTFESLYRVTCEVLGEGLSGEVRLAEHRRTGTKVAVKTYSLSKLSPRQIADLTREARCQASLEHPNVARVEAVFQTESHVHLLVEHLSGGDVFKDIVAVGLFGESHAKSLVRQLLGAVEHMHAQGLVHRDIKPENMAYTSADRDEVKLIDFGFCAKWKEGDAPMVRRCGTDGYMAPELVTKRGYTSLADVWSVGVVAHVLLTGDMPGRQRDWTPILSRKMADCSPEAQKFVRALLVVDPADRPTAKQALAHSWMLDEVDRCDRCDSTCSTVSTYIEPLSSEADFDRVSPKPLKEGFSTRCPSSERSAPKEHKSIWHALPTLRLDASRRVGAVFSAVRNYRSKRTSRVSFEVDL